MLSKKQFFKIFKTKYPFWAYSPRGILDISFAVKISENGGIGLIDTSSFSKIETKDLVMQIDQKLAKNQMWGVRIEDIEIISEIPHNIQIPILICAFNPQIEELKSLKQHAKFVVGEVNFLEEAQRTCQIFDFFLVKGNEAGGLVSSKSNFILIQEFHKAGYTFIIQGGFGIFNISSAFIGGACGVVFESQLYLLEESPINPSFKNYLTTIAENDFYLFGESEDYNYRLIGKLANKAIRETKKLEKSLLNQLNQIDEKNSVKIKKKFKEQLKLIYQTNSSFNHSNPKHSFLPTDHAICFASRIAEKYKNISNFFKGINDLLKTQIKSVKDNWPFKPNSEFTQLLKIKYPIIQGPMANVSDTIEFARKVAESGALPTFALGGLMGYEASALLKEATVDPIAEYSFAAGIIGLEVAKERRTQHLDAIKKYGPKITLIAAGSPDLGTQVKNQGQIVLFHAPSLSIFKLALKRNLDYLILEGKECGGHIGTLTSFILWENVLQYLDQIRNQLSEKINIVFAGGLLNHTSSAMLAAMLGNHLSLINPGIQMGTAYLFTPEIVSEKALSVEYQNQLLNNCKTCVIGTTVNTRARVIPTEFSNTIIRKENEWVANGVKIAKRKELYENNNLGALRIATKAEIWNNNHVEGTGTTQFISTSKKKQLSSGAFMAGDALCLRSSLVSIPKLHYDIIKKGEEFLNKNTLNETLSKIFLDNELKNKEILLKDQIESSSQANQELIENDDRIAIVGLGCIFPDANNIKEYWNNILNKKYSVSEIPKERWDIDIYYDPDKKAPAKSYTKIGAFVKNFKFKSIKYRIPPQIADHMDDVQKWALVAAEEALLDANYPVNGKNPLPIAVIIGNSLGGEIQRSTNKHVIFNEIAYYLSNNHKNHQEVEQNEKILQYLKEKLLTNIPEITEDTMPGELSNIISGRVSNAFNLTGKSMTTDAACASSLAAINTAINGLLMGDYDVVLAGGADRSMDPSTYIKFCKIGALSEDGSYPFDARANGFVMGEGVGFVVLKRVKDAIEANDKIYAIIRGIGSSSDGRGKGITAPNPSRQKLAIERALTASKLNFDQLQYVECHGTSTVIGDAAELKLLEEISQNTKVDRRIALGSVKSQIGHLKSAAAIASIIKTSLALYNKVLPPSINFKNPNPKVDWSKSAFYVNTETKAWESNLDELRRAGISAFGFGGTNYHAILEEYQPKISQSPQELTLASESLKEKSNLCFLFSGQGSQYLGMAKQLYHSIPEIKKVFDQANLICKEFGKFDLIEVIFGSESLTQKENQNRLTQTQFTQPAIYTVEISISEYLKKQGIVPNYLAGHSLGEYAALVNAGVLNFEDGLKAVILRGKAMANASSDVESSMAAIFSSQNEVSRILDQYSIENVNISNLNSMSQTVISGEKQSIKNAVKIFNSENITAKELNVSQGFHSKYVKHAEIEMEKYLDSINFSSPTIPVYSNVSGKIYPSDPKQIKNLLIQQITSPVRWVDEIKALYTDRARKFIEIGPKKALFYFAKDILKNKKEVSINYTLSPKKDEIKHLKEIVEQFTYNEHINKRRSEVKFSLREESKKQKPLIKQAYRKSKISKVSDIGSELLTSLSSSHNIIDKDSIPNLPYFSEFIQNQKEFVNDLIFSGYQQYINNVKPIVNQLNEYKKFGFNISRIGVTGVGLGLPGKSRNVFDENNIADILSGKNFIDLITIDEKQKFVSKHINQIHKSPSGDAKFVELDDISKVIHLAGQLGHYHPEKDYKIEKKLLSTLDITSQLAICAGLEALKDAKIPLVRSHIKTTTGKLLSGDWALPKELRDETGVIFSSAFPGYDQFAEEITQYLHQEYRSKTQKEQKELFEKLISQISNSNQRSKLKKWFKAEFHNYEDNENQFKQFSRKFLFKVLAMGHSQFAQLIKAKGPNTHINVACASGSQAIGIAENWIRIGRCNRVIIISADNSTSKNLFPWIGSGFLASGAATTQESFENAVLPFGKGRNGLILGAGASALVIEDFPSSIKRGINPIVEILGTYYSNSAFHGSRLDKSHIIGEFEKFISQMVQRYDLSKQELAEQGFFMSHETYTPARGGSAETELEVLSSSFGKDVRKMIITNTKGFTGHPLGVGIEEAVAIKALEFEKIPPIANYSNIDPIFKAKYTFSNGLQTSKKYAIRFAAGFGSQLSINLFKFYARGERRLEPEYSKWLEKISGTNELFYDGKVLKVKTIKPEESVQISQSQKDFTHKNEIVSPTITKINQRNLLNTIKQIIAEITGYEPEDIESDYDLEEDLGIDTIKQAEIFGEIRAKWQIPEDIEVNLADFRTIKDILEFLTRNISQSKENDNVLAAFQSDFGSNIEDIEQKIKQIIADITGYEPEDIESDYDLEEDLGIDTIKQAEIFGEIRAKWQIPEDIEVNLADFRTIKDILEFLTKTITLSEEIDNNSATIQSELTSNIEDTEQKIKQIIADITGYEPEDIESDYDLEEDLGIDTIKQAEIFGEIRAKWQIPEDIEVNLADFRTIKDILEFLTKTITPSEEISNISATVQSELTSNIEDTEQKIKQIIAKITGYEPEDIETDYDLEEDLGIDTIKQAEIFGEIRSKWQIPEDIEVNLADFRTIKDIQEFLYQKSAQKSLISSKTSKTDKSEEIDGELEDQNQIQIYDFKPFQIDYPNENKSAIKLNSQTTLWLSILEEETQNSELAHLFKDNFDSYTKVNIDLSTDLTSKKVLDKEYSQIIITHPYNSSIDYSKALILFSKLFEYFHNNYIQSIQKLILYSFEDLIDEYYKSNSNSSYVVNPLVGALNVFCRSLSKEFNFEFKHISASTSSYLITEMKYWDNLKEIFYDKTGNRYTLIKIPINTKQNNKEIEIDSNDIMIVTGGAHGIAFDCIDSLTMNYQPKIALIGRTSLDDSIKQYLDYSKDQLNEYEKEFKKLQKERYPEATPLFIRKNWQRFIYKIKIHRNIKKLKEKGLNVEYYSADVLDLKQVKDAITKIKSSFKGDIKILIHAAGIEESKSFLKKQLDMAQKIVKVKVVGLANLFECIDEKDLKLCMMFSSIAGRYGNIAQIDYAFANGFLSRLAWNKQKCPYLAIDWSAWAGKGMATRGSTKKVLTMAGVVPIPLEKGAKIFTELIKNRFLGEYLVCGDLGQFELTQSNKFTVSDPTFPCLNQILYKDNKIHAEKILNLQDDIYLLDHQIEQQPIFPGVMGLEMFIEFNNFMNHNDVKQIKNVEFNKPIKLLSKKPVEIRVSLNSNINQLTIETIRYPKILKGKPKLTQHFSAQLFNEDSLQNEKDIITKSEKRGFKFFQNFNTNQSNFDLLTKEEIYEIFFHGNSFQVLDGLEQFISNGSITRVKFPQETMMLLNKGKPKSKISNKDFHVNVLGIESLFQAAGLYNLLANNNLSLPSTIGELKIGKTDNRDWNEPKHAIVEFLYQKADISYFDAVLLDKNQNLIIKLDKLGLVHTQLPIKTSKEISRKIEILSRSISFQVKSKIDLINILPISIINENFSIAQKKVEKNQKNNIEGNSSQDGVLMINDYLTLNEIKKFDRITNIKRKLHFLTGHLALKELIQQVDPNLKPYNQIEINYTIKGKPYIPPFEVKDPSKEKKFYPSITHSGDYAIAVLDQSQIGIDLEKVEEHLDTFYSEVFTDQEQSKIGKDKVLATKFWTVKEAFLKAIGEGLNLNIKDLSVDFISNNESEHDVNLPSIFSIKTENNNTQIDILAKKSKITSYYIKDYVLSICYINTQEGR